MSFTLLELFLNGEIDVNDFVGWFYGKSPQSKNCDKLLALEQFRCDFNHFLLSYIREETLIHVQDSRHSGITPKKSLENKLEQENLRKTSSNQSARGRLEFASNSSKVVSSSSPSASSASGFYPLQGAALREDAPRTPLGTKNHVMTKPFEKKSEQKLNLELFLPNPKGYNHYDKNRFVLNNDQKPNLEQSVSNSIGFQHYELMKNRFVRNNDQRYDQKPKSGLCLPNSRGCNHYELMKNRFVHKDQFLDHKQNKEPVLNLKDDSAFPPIGMRITENKRSVVTRRITPTPVSQQRGRLPGSEGTVSAVMNETTSASFEGVASHEFPVSYEGERELLRQERAKRQSEIRHVDSTKADNPVSSVESSFDCSFDTSLNVVTLSIDDVTCKQELNILSELYANLIQYHLITSISVELHFLVQLITIRGTSQDDNFSTTRVSYFKNAANCVYFALNVLWKQRYLLHFLDRSTLRLLFENPRVKPFHPNLWLHLKDACEVAKSVSQCNVPIPSSLIGSVAFHSDTDNKNNFINEQGFNFFRKKRDLFYEIFREWESKRLNPEYDIKLALYNRIHALVYIGNDSTTLVHLARLFQSQLIVTCKGEDLVEDESDSLDLEPLEALKKSNPDKYKRLAERFVACKHRFSGPSPKPSFTGYQEFFRSFITIAGSHVFNQHLIDCLSTKISELNNVQFSFSDSDLEEEGDINFDNRDGLVSCLLTLRLLAKFLGFIVFLPYHDKDVMSEDLMITQAALRQETSPVFDFDGFVRRSIHFRRTILTIPWIVEFLSMMDPVATRLSCYRKVLNTLHLFVESHQLELYISPPDFNLFFLLTILGWLFEVINYVKISDNDVNANMNSFIDEKVDFVKLRKTCLDPIPLIDLQILYICCPYLADLRIMLSEFLCGIGGQRGSMRKITPLLMNSSSLVPISTRHLQVQLEENFFHNHPVSLKRTVDFVTDRISSNTIKHVRKVILPSVRRRASVQIKEISSSMKDLGVFNSLSVEVKCEAAIKVHNISLVAAEEAKSETLHFAKELCPKHAESVLNLLLPDDSSPTVVEICVKIVQRTVLKKVSQWFTTNVVAVVYEKELVCELQKQLKADSDSTLDKPLLETAGLATVHDDTVPGPASLVRTLKHLLKTLYDTSNGISMTNEEAMNVVVNIITVLNHRSDVTNMVARTLIQQSVDYAMGLVLRCPEILTDSLQDEFVRLWMSNREISSQFLECIICSRNIHYLTWFNCSEANWTKFNEFIAKLIHSELVIKAHLLARMERVKELKWPKETIECLEKLEPFLVDF